MQLEDGRTVIADEAFLRESILNPNAKIVKGYQREYHAGFPGADQRRGSAATDRLHQEPVWLERGAETPAQPASDPPPNRFKSNEEPTMSTTLPHPRTSESGPIISTSITAGNHGCSPPTISGSRCCTCSPLRRSSSWAALFAVGMRINLLTPEGVFSHDTYNKLFTMHGIIMVFFFLVPSIPATLGNFLIPIMIGARDLAFPRINLLSWYIYIVGGILALFADRQGRRRYRLDVLRARSAPPIRIPM